MASKRQQRVLLAQRVREAHARRRPGSRRPLTYPQLEAAIDEGLAAAQHASDVRLRHARKQLFERETDIQGALERMALAMVPLRSEAGRLAHDPALERAYGDRLRSATSAIRAQRRRLYKMR